MFSSMKPRRRPLSSPLSVAAWLSLGAGAVALAQSTPAEGPSAGSDQAPTDTAEPETERTVEPEERERIDRFFAICDHDENGWIAYREAAVSLELDRPAYASYDVDRDGRIVPAEFERRYFEIVDIAGGFAEPAPYEGPRLLPSRNPEQLRAAFDASGDGALELFELEKLLEAYGRQDIPASIVLSKLDVDATRRLEIAELGRLSQLLSATYVEAAEDLATELANSVEELFGGLVDRSVLTLGATYQPPLIIGPVSPFRRLDLDHDGAIEIDDLTALQRPQTLSVRVAAIVAALDANGDGVVDREEFLRAVDD